MADTILIKGAREHNLKDIGLELPRDRLIVLTGQQEIGVQRMCGPIRGRGQARRHQRLPQHLAAEHGGRADAFTAPTEQVRAGRLHLDQIDQAFQRVMGVRFDNGGFRCHGWTALMRTDSSSR